MIRLTFAFFFSVLVCSHAAEKPNVIVIMADDYGVGSSNVYGASKDLIRTPHIDRLAANGMRFTNADAPASICSPTRYALITGRYAWRGPLPFGVVGPNDPLVVEKTAATLPRALQKLGYRTAHIGKWHLGYGDKKPANFTEKLTPGPNDIGFDYHFGLPQNLDDRWRVYVENDGVYGLRSKKLSPYAKNFYGGQYAGLDAPQSSRETAMEDLTEKSVDWIQRTHREDPKKPFFLSFNPPATHHPIVPSEKMRGTSGCGAYGDFIHDLDHSVGRIVEALEYEGIADNTIIIFTADNGADIPVNDPNRPENQAQKAGLKPNGVNRGDKHTVWQGGMQVPLIVQWDGKVKPGSTSAHLVNLVDIYSTLVEAVSTKVPSPAEAPDSISFLPTLLGENQPPRQASVLNNLSGLKAIRDGKWKFTDGRFPDGVPQEMKDASKEEAQLALYDLAEDPTESKNLVNEHPEIVQRLQATLDRLRQNDTRSGQAKP